MQKYPVSKENAGHLLSWEEARIQSLKSKLSGMKNGVRWVRAGMRLTYCCIVALIFIIAKYLFNPFASEFRFIILSIIAFYLPYFLIFRDGSIDNFICEFNNKVDIVYWEYKGEKSSFDFERKIVQAFLLDEDVNSISTKFEYSSRLVIKTLKKYHCLPEDYDDFNK